MNRCTLCDLGALAKTDPEGAVAVTLMLGCSAGDIDELKKLMCASHRERWALILLTGGARLSEVAP